MQIKSLSYVVACSFLAACGGGGGTSATGALVPTQDVTGPASNPAEGAAVPQVTVTGQPTTPSEETGTTTQPATPADATVLDNMASGDTATTIEPTTPADTIVQENTASDGVTPQIVTGPAEVVVTPPPVPVLPPLLLSFFFSDTTSLTTAAGAGTLDQASDQIALSGLTGKISEDGSTINLDGGGQITVIANEQNHAGLYQAEPISGSPSFGVFGQPTDFTTVSLTGTAAYTGIGTAIVQIIDNSDLYDLTGDVAANVNFDSALVDLAISDLQGQRSNGLSSPVEVIDVAQISITGARLSNGAFEGGTASFAGTEIDTTLSGAEVVSTNGGFFGASGNEIGGVFVINDTNGTGTLLIQGQYIADMK